MKIMTKIFNAFCVCEQILQQNLSRKNEVLLEIHRENSDLTTIMSNYCILFIL